MRFKLSNLQNKRGFTLIEMVIFTAIASIVITASAQIFIASLSTRTIIRGEQLILTDARFMEHVILSRAEMITSITEPASGSSSRFEFTTATPAESPVVFELVDNDVFMTVGTDSPVQLNNPAVQVTSFTIEHLAGSPSSLALSFDLETETFSGATPNLTVNETFTLLYE